VRIDSSNTCLGALGNYVWVDSNANGVQEANEPGLPNVQVALFKNGTFVRFDTTDGSGYYLFDNLEPGIYTVQFIPEPHMKITTSVGAGDNGDNTNSDADPNAGVNYGYTSGIEISLREIDTTIDAGVFYTVPLQVNGIQLSLLGTDVANELQWKAINASVISEYHVYKGRTSSDMQLLHSQSASLATKYNDAQLAKDGKATYYYVVGIDAWNNEIKSNIVQIVRDGSTVQVFPNPAQTIVNVVFDKELIDDELVKLTDASGRVIMTTLARSGEKQTSFNVEQLAAGTYNIEIPSRNIIVIIAKQ
jgi:hypothetical protein